MSEDLKLEMADRRVASIPARLKFASELKGPVAFFEPTVGSASIGYIQNSIYSINCMTEVVLPRQGLGGKPQVMLDLRMGEVALDLIQASVQSSDDAENACMDNIISRLALEQSLGFFPGILHAGFFFERLDIEARQEVLIRRKLLEIENLSDSNVKFHLEQIIQFFYLHEITHYCLFSDVMFRKQWVEFARDVIIDSCDALHKSFEDEYAKIHFRNRMQEGRQVNCDNLGAFPNIEELICDLSAIKSLFDAMELLNKSDLVSEGFVLSILAAITATWLVATIRNAIRDLLTIGSADLRTFHNILFVRGSVAVLSLTQMLGAGLGLQVEDLRKKAAEIWRKQPDFESLILGTLNPYFSSEHLEQAAAVGEAAMSSGLCTKRSVNAAIHAHFGWSRSLPKSRAVL